jgi:hypothetical protein
MYMSSELSALQSCECAQQAVLEQRKGVMKRGWELYWLAFCISSGANMGIQWYGVNARYNKVGHVI